MLNPKDERVAIESDVTDGARLEMAERVLSPEEMEKIETLLGAEESGSSDWDKEEAERVEDLRQNKESYLKKLAPESDTSWGGPRLDHNQLDGLLSRLLKNNQNGEFDQLIVATCEAFLRVPLRVQGWNHSVCHNFESLGAGLLQNSKFLDVAARLVDQGAERMLRGDYCFDRIMKGVIWYNKEGITQETLHSAFPFKPECLRHEDVQVKFQNCFATANTPYEYLLARIKEDLASTGELYSGRISFELLELLHSEETNALLDAYIEMRYAAKNGGIPGMLALEGLRSAVSAEVLPGVFVDVEGTLIRHEKLDQRLSSTLDALCPRSDGVIIFTGGDAVALTSTLREAGFPERFLPVKAKDHFRGQKLEFLIDDTHAELQGFLCQERIEPYIAVGRLKELDPQRAIKAYHFAQGNP